MVVFCNAKAIYFVFCVISKALDSLLFKFPMINRNHFVPFFILFRLLLLFLRRFDSNQFKWFVYVSFAHKHKTSANKC